MPDHVFLSPHLDDAILSCGGMIHQQVQQGNTAMIYNIMSGDPPNPLPDTPLVRELHERWKTGENPVADRRREDEAAARTLGAQVWFMDIPDCVYRTAEGVALYPVGDEDIFGEVHPADPAHAALKNTPLPAAKVLYVPLSMGHHVDHQLVREWVLSTAFHEEAGRNIIVHAPKDVQILFYEDYPYSDNEEVRSSTLAHFPAPLESSIIKLTEADFEAKCAAIAQYQSQISTFWGSIDEMKSRVRAALLRTGDGTLAERYWHITSR